MDKRYVASGIGVWLIMQRPRSCAMRIAIAIGAIVLSPHAIAQNPAATVTYGSGEYSKTIAGVRPLDTTQNLSVPIVVPALLCGVPNADAIKTNLQAQINANDLTSSLAGMESVSITNLTSAIQAFFYLMYPHSTSVGGVHQFAGGTHQLSIPYYGQGQLNSTWAGGGAYVHSIASDCVTVDEAKQLILETRKAIRKYLSLPPPQ